MRLINSFSLWRLALLLVLALLPASAWAYPAASGASSANVQIMQGTHGALTFGVLGSPYSSTATYYIVPPGGGSPAQAIATGSPVQSVSQLPSGWGTTIVASSTAYVQVPLNAPVGQGYTAYISDPSQGEFSASFDVVAAPPVLAVNYFQISPNSVQPGVSVTGAVTLNQTVSSATNVALSLKGSSGTGSISFPSSVTVPASSAGTGAFPITVNSFGSGTTNITVEASCNGSVYDASVTLVAASSSGGSSGGGSQPAAQNLVVWGYSTYQMWVYDLGTPFTGNEVGEYLTIKSGSDLTAGTYKVVDKALNYSTIDGNENMISLDRVAGAPNVRGGTYTLSTSAPAVAPGATISVSPTSVVAGSPSTLTWSTSGASTISVTGQNSPAASGSVSVSPQQTTTYTITASNSAGTTTETATLTVTPASSGSTGCFGSSAGCGDGSSTYLPITGLVGSSAPGDLKIGIPGIGSISFPTGWWTQLIAFAMASVNMTGGFLQNAMNAAANATIASMTGGFSAVQNLMTGIGSTIGTDITTGTTDLHGIIDTGTSRIIGTSTSLEKTVVSDFQSMLQSLFVPDPSSMDQFKNEYSQFIDWGPYHFVSAFQSALTAAPGDGKIGGIGLEIPMLSVNATPGTVLNLTGGGGAVGGVGLSSVGSGVVLAPAYTWYPTGGTVPFGISQVTSSPGWATVRGIFGGIVWLLWGAGLVSYLMPKQVV